MSDMMSETMRLGEWQRLCLNAQSHATAMSHDCCQVAREIMNRLLQRFCQLPAPRSDRELALRNAQQWVFSSRVASITNADRMARGLSVQAAQEIMQETAAMADKPIPDTEDEAKRFASEGMALNTRIGTICHADKMRSMRG